MDRKGMLALGLVGVALAAAGCDDCQRSGCLATARPATGTIDQGIAGAASSESDACTPGCCKCPLSSANLTVLPTDAPVTDAASAEALLASDQTRQSIEIAERYEQELVVGTYLGCMGSSPVYVSACAPFAVEEGRVTTVHARLAFGPGQVAVFTPSGDPGPPSFEVYWPPE